MNARKVVFLASDCIGCGKCLETCAGDAFIASGGLYGIVFKPEKCLGCAVCQAGLECTGECIK
jgi:Na+-translocating ferredoxin:NAD+ oxidoreductase RNF subunit RnfB